jgi:DNA-binding NtrC family response regulator
MATTQTSRPTVLVVEDEFIVALDLSEMVKDLGYALEGPFADRHGALRAIKGEMPDAAILDVVASDGEIFPLADTLTEAGVPIIFHSGQVSPGEMVKRYPDAHACAKPCPPDRLIDALQEAIERRANAIA